MDVSIKDNIVDNMNKKKKTLVINPIESINDIECIKIIDKNILLSIKYKFPVTHKLIPFYFQQNEVKPQAHDNFKFLN